MTKRTLFALAIFLAVFQIFSLAETNAQTANWRNSKERFVVQSARTIFGAEMTYQATVGAGTYATLAELRQADFIDAVLASGEKYGYLFALTRTHATATSPAKFSLSVTPRSYPKNGRRSFYIDESGEMHAADKTGAPADVNDPVISECDSYGILDNERCTVIDLRKIMNAQMTYASTVGNGNYGLLDDLFKAGLINSRLASGTNHGYNFWVNYTSQSPGFPAFFSSTATPVNYGVTGIRSFYIDVNGILRGADKQGAPADAADPPILE